MDAIEATKLLAHASAFDNRKPSKAASIAWAEALHDIPADVDAFAAVARFYAKPSKDSDLDSTRWIQPHHVRALRKEIRSERTPETGSVPYVPLDADESGSEFVRRRRAQLEAVANGDLHVEPIRQLEGGPHPSVAKALANIGQMPDHIRAELAEVGIGKRRGMWPELAIACPLHQCRALPHRPCRTPSGREMKQGTHPSRQDAYRRKEGA